jgi:hypothetical protein
MTSSDASYLTNYSQLVECSRMMSKTITDNILTLSANKITGLIEPVTGTDAANKNYTDTHPAGSAVSGSNTDIQYNNLSAFASSGSLTFDGSTFVSSDGILIGNTYSAVVQNLTYYSSTLNSSAGISYTAGASAGSEVVTSTGPIVNVQISDGVTTGNNIVTAIRNDYYTKNMLSVVVSSGLGLDPQTIQSFTPLTLASTLNTGIVIKSGLITNLSDIYSGYNYNYVTKNMVDRTNILTTTNFSNTGAPLTYTKAQVYNGLINRTITGTSTAVTIDVMPSALNIISNTVSGTNSALTVLAASTVDIPTLTGTNTTMDGVILNNIGLRVLLKNQVNMVNNGVWIVNSGAWTRPADFVAGSNCYGYNIAITQGILGASTMWTCSAPSPAIVDTDKLVFSRAVVSNGTSFDFSLANRSTSGILQLSPGSSLTFDPTSLIGSFIYPGYELKSAILITNNLAGSESATMIASSLRPVFSNSSFMYGQRSVNNTVANTVVRTNYTFNTKPTVYTGQNLTYQPTNILGLIIRSFEGTKVDGFGAVSTFISGFSSPNSPVSYIFSTGGVKMYVKNESTVGTLTIIPSVGWTMDQNSNMTIPAGQTGTFWVYIDVENVTCKVYVISIV